MVLRCLRALMELIEFEMCSLTKRMRQQDESDHNKRVGDCCHLSSWAQEAYY